MTRLRVLASRALAVFRTRRRDGELQDEIQTHLDLLAAEQVRNGMSPTDARVAARRQFGGVEQVKEAYRDQRGLPFADVIGQDLWYAFGQLRKNPGFAAAAIVTLALGTGANTAIFSVLNASVRGSSFRNADQLVMIWTTPPAHPEANEGVSVPEYLAWKERNQAFDRIGAMIAWSGNLGSTTNGVPAERLVGQRFTASLFELLGVRPEVGRLFTEEEDAVGAPVDVAVISHRLWHTRFAGDPMVINRTVLLDGTATKIVGVMPPGFSFFDDECDYWIPFAPTPFQVRGSSRAFTVVARLKPRRSIQQAQTEMDAVAAELARVYPDRNKGRGVRVQSLDDAYFGDVRQLLFVLQGAVGFILLIACANVAGLLLVRGASRQKEVAIRYSLGAGRLRILRQLVTESMLLAFAGGALGLVLAWGGLRLLLTSSPAWLSHVHDIAIDAQVLAFTTAVSLGTGLGFGVVPALQVSRADPIASLKDCTRGATGGRGPRRIQRVLVAAQIALTLVLLIGAGLVMKSFARLQSANLGFDPKGLLSFESRLPFNQYYKPIGTFNGFTLYDMSPVPPLLFDRVLQRIQGFPSVQSAAGINQPPVSGAAMQIPFAIEGRLPTDSGGVSDQETLTTNYSLVTPNFFSTMRIPMRRGRDFSSRDTADGVWVAIINEAMARRFWPHDDPIGKRLTATIVPDEQPREIIGVVGDMALSRWERVRSPMLYVSHLQQPLHYRAPYGQDRVQMTFVLRTLQRPEAVIPALRRAVSDVDSSAPVAHVQTIEQHLARQVDAPRYYLVLLGIFGAVAMTLATSGIYGVIAYSVAERRREIAIRVAFGADARRVVTLVLREGVLLTAVGLMLGLAGAVALTRFLAAVLWEVTPTDPGTFIGVALFLAAIALLASLMPARRALRLDPMVVLGSE